MCKTMDIKKLHSQSGCLSRKVTPGRFGLRLRVSVHHNEALGHAKTTRNIHNEALGHTKTIRNIHNEALGHTKTIRNIHNEASRPVKTTRNIHNEALGHTKTTRNIHNEAPGHTKTTRNIHNEAPGHTKTTRNIHRENKLWAKLTKEAGNTEETRPRTEEACPGVVGRLLPPPGAMAPGNTTQYLMEQFYQGLGLEEKRFLLREESTDSYEDCLSFQQRDFEEHFGALW